ncbi:hypothetical protein J2S43_001316 [Catenuloplanes nepalensis]|uniref:Uncharacterized protein n=1 Tax=Catenuloplanes nepalensis TaxID=587533 RepID=A0ABT9MN25_9ACTN|nr:hypothetical protein [Catenuloplanes nepalensis]MDP9792804.1 hypothetical protein [Catenuloplanes nepalensis]
MARKIINIFGVDQPVEAWVDPLTGRARVGVAGQGVAENDGLTFRLPGAEGHPVVVRATAGTLEPYPVLTIRDVDHHIGPPAPPVLRALIFVPVMLALMFLIFFWTLPVGAALVYLNIVIVRTGLPDPAKVALCLLPTMAAIAVVCGTPTG